MIKWGGLTLLIIAALFSLRRYLKRVTEGRKEFNFIFFCDENRELDKSHRKR